jgi:hypothetical protein
MSADVPGGATCPPGIPLGHQFSAPNLLDGNVNTVWPTNPNAPHHEIVTLYGIYGQDEQHDPLAMLHYNQGISLAGNIKPLCSDGSTQNCPDSMRKIVFVGFGFSNCDIEFCGGDADAWQGQDTNLQAIAGEPCATKCNNPGNPDPTKHPWLEPTNPFDTVTQSFLYQVYQPIPQLVDSHVIVFDGALGQQSLERWDPTAIGYYTSNDCKFPGLPQHDPECNYDRVAQDLNNNGFAEAQVQAILIKGAVNFPRCDLSGLHCVSGVTEPDAYTAERYLGDIVRYLKCCKADGTPRYPNLKQVFITSRTYGGYAKNTGTQGGQFAGCVSPEPYAFEEAFAVRRLIVAQISQAGGGNPPVDGYAGAVKYPDNAPWFDWGPYLWTNGDQGRSDGLLWCNGQTAGNCRNRPRDVRYGDLTNDMQQQMFWGDYTHPSQSGAEKVAGKLVEFIGAKPGVPGSPFITPWILPH